MMRQDDLYWIWLSLRLGPGRASVSPLLERYGTPENIFALSGGDLAQTEQIGRGLAKALSDKSTDDAYRVMRDCEQKGYGIIRYDSSAYPERLRRIENPPVLLYYRGTLPDFRDELCIGMVGSRKASEYGKRNAYTLSYELASCGGVVISGMAEGIDAMAACGALEAGGKTVAVFGCGLDITYPAEHKILRQKIEENGLLLSEFPPTTPADIWTFPMRNRIVSGLSHGVCVVEAAKKSGALITAHLALTQGRDLFAVPGNLGDPHNEGTNQLLRDGVTTILNARDILAQYPEFEGAGVVSEYGEYAARHAEWSETVLASYGLWKPEKPKLIPKEKTPFIPAETFKPAPERSEEDLAVLSAEERELYDAIPQNGDFSPEDCTLNGWNTTKILCTLTMLEIKGFIASCPGGRYRRR